MLNNLQGLLRGVWQLRHPELRRLLGEMRFRSQQLEEIRGLCPGVKLADGIEWVGYEAGRLVAAPGASICHGTVLAFGDDANGYGQIRIGANTWLGQYDNLRACGEGDIVIGAHCLVSQFCTLVGSNHAIDRDCSIVSQGPDRTRLGVTLGDDVWLGAGVVVAPGTKIGKGAVIGANSVVTHDVPDYEIWAGVPARKIGVRD